jgi:hypothetical protein
LLVFVLLAGAEVALRLPHVRTLLPPRTHYYHPAITTRLDAVERMRTEGRAVDVLFIGSSIVMTNVNPRLFGTIVANDPGEIVVFNAGLPGLWPTSVHLYAEHVWLPTVRPRLVVQGVRYPELAATTHAKNETQVWSGKIEPSWRDHDFRTQLYAGLISNVYLLQYRGAGVRWLQRFRDGWLGTDPADSRAAYDAHGYEPLQPVTTRPDEWEPDLPSDGMCGVNGCEVGFTALKRTVAAARAAGSSYVLMNVPEHSIRWSGPGGIERYRDYLGRLRAFAEAEGVGFVDPTDGDPFRFAQTPYADLAHMTSAGSSQFTRVLADHMEPLVTSALGDPRRELQAADRAPSADREQLTEAP